MIKKMIYLSVFSLLVSNCVFAGDCEIVHKSIKYYQNQNPDNICSLYNLANEYYIKHKYQKALNTYEDIITINPKEERAYLKRAEIYNKFEKYENADREYIKLVRNIPDSVSGNYWMSHVCMYVFEDYEKALIYINKAIELSKGENILYFYDRANILEKIGIYEEAIEDYTKYAKSNDKYNYHAYFGIRNCYEALGNNAKAKEAILKWDYGCSKNPPTLAQNIKWKFSSLKSKFHDDFLY